MDMSTYREVFRRTEIKYLIDEGQYKALMNYMEGMAEVDAYGLSRINNIYYDTQDHLLVRTSIEKPLYKEKLRLRTYGVTKDDTNAFVEIKKKYDGVVYKRRISGEYGEMYRRLSGREACMGDGQIAKEIEAFIRLYGELVPAMRICYDRLAMAGIQDKDFRVTFDSNIEWSTESRDLREAKTGRALLKPGQYLMEIKISNAFPIGLADKLSELKIFPASFSKYGAGYADMLRCSRVRITERIPAMQGSETNRKRTKGEMAYV